MRGSEVNVVGEDCAAGGGLTATGESEILRPLVFSNLVTR